MSDQRGDPKPERSQKDGTDWKWRFEGEPSIETTSYPQDDAVGTAWLRLQLVHTSFRLIDAKDYRELAEKLEAIERLFLESPNLTSYYDQCFAPENRPDLTGPRAPVIDLPEIKFVAAMQVQFLEDLFFALDLDRYGNAPDNRGWMNLFRRWGRSPTFNKRLDELRATLTLGFLEFYDLYLRYHPCRIDERPIPHPWDSESRRRDYRWGDDWPSPPPPPPTGGDLGPGPCGPPPTREAAAAARAPLFPGLFLDSGIQEVEDHSARLPGQRAGQEIGSAGGGLKGQTDEKGGQGPQPPSQSGPTPDADTNKPT